MSHNGWGCHKCHILLRHIPPRICRWRRSGTLPHSHHTSRYWYSGCSAPLDTLQIKRRDADGLVQDCSKSSALALELLLSCTKPSIEHSLLIVKCFISQLFIKDTHSSPVRARYGVSFVSSLLDLYLALVIVLLHVNDLVQYCSISIANALEILQSCKHRCDVRL